VARKASHVADGSHVDVHMPAGVHVFADPQYRIAVPSIAKIVAAMRPFVLGNFPSHSLTPSGNDVTGRVTACRICVARCVAVMAANSDQRADNQAAQRPDHSFWS
jgi:hypothetical protein